MTNKEHEASELRVGIVGCGHIANIHIRALKRSGNCRITSICDLNRDRAESFAKKYNIQGVYFSLQSMLKSEELDIIHVLTPPQFHAPVAIEAMDAGCHVITEKPMCITVDEADKMIEASKRNNVKLGVVHSFLFNPAIQEAIQILKSGIMGKLLVANVDVSLFPLLQHIHPKWMNTLPGGLFGEIIPHGLYVLRAFTGNVKEVKCIIDGKGDSNGLFPFKDLHVSVNGENSKGTLYISTRIESPYTIMSVKIVAEKGAFDINIPTATLIKHVFGTSTGLVSRAGYGVSKAYQYLSACGTLGLKTVFGKVKPQMTHEIVISGFLESVYNETDPLVTAEDGRELTKTTQMIWKQVL